MDYLIIEYSKKHKSFDSLIVKKDILKINYKGYIYCVETNPYHTIYVRRNGKCMWSGNSTIKDYELYTGMTLDSQRNVKFDNGSIIMFRHLEEINNIQNINLGWFAIEQAEELETDEEFFMLFGRLRRKNCGIQTGFIIANTKGHNWIWKLYKKGELEDSMLVEATTEDNAINLDPPFLETLKIIQKRKPKIYNRFVLNSWEEEDTVDIIINPQDVRNAVARPLVEMYIKKTVLVCDPARYGDDEIVSYIIQNNQVIFQEIYSKKDAMEVTGKLITLKNRFDASIVAVDGIGLGAGIVDRLLEIKKAGGEGWKVFDINSAKKSSDPLKYRNVRAEMSCKAAEKFYNNMVSIPDDPILIEQLSTVKFKTIESSGCQQVESKELVKKRLGNSPDRADALVMGLYAMEYSFIDTQREKTKRQAWSY